MYRLICIVFLCIYAFDAYAQDSQQFSTWKTLENGLEILESGQDTSNFMVVRLALKKHSIKILRAQDFGKKDLSAAEVCSLSGALMCINGSFFDERHNPLGLIISSGIMFQKNHLGGDTLNGIFYLSRKGFGIVERGSFSSQLAFEAMQAGPVLIKDGKNLRGATDNNVSKRSAVCLDSDGRPIFFVSAIGAKPSSLFELSDFMLRKDFSCQNAINLDGGSSSQFFLKSGRNRGQSVETSNYEIAGEDKVPVFLGIIEGMPF
jgi:uncharacterized protein YigE (DUF2233 family)